MNMNHFIGILLSLLFFFATTGRADEYTYLTVSQSEGTTNFEVSQIEKISFDQSDMIVWLSNGSEERLPLAGLSKMFFSKGLQGITQLSASGSKIKVENGLLKVQVDEGEAVFVYNLKGEEILSARHSIAYNLNQLPKGAYIVRVGNESKKLMTR